MALLLKSLVLLAVIATVCADAQGQDDVRQPLISFVAEVDRDTDNDGTPDLEGQKVNVTGRITLPPGSSPFGKNTAYVQDRTGGILLHNVKSLVAEGDSVRVSGTIILKMVAPLFR
ncbi:MAG: hypothetical protein HKN43_07845 [Rhodothermales bacterium]|nr:hypothetical protein [Rhodothermales bacterium]